MGARKYARVTDEQKAEILDYFYTQNDNRTTVMAKLFGIQVVTVSHIIEKSLSKKANYMNYE